MKRLFLVENYLSLPNLKTIWTLENPSCSNQICWIFFRSLHQPAIVEWPMSYFILFIKISPKMVACSQSKIFANKILREEKKSSSTAIRVPVMIHNILSFNGTAGSDKRVASLMIILSRSAYMLVVEFLTLSHDSRQHVGFTVNMEI